MLVIYPVQSIIYISQDAYQLEKIMILNFKNHLNEVGLYVERNNLPDALSGAQRRLLNLSAFTYD